MSIKTILQLLLIVALILSGLRPIGDPLTGIILLTIVTASIWTITARKTWQHASLLSTWMLVYLIWLFIPTFTSTIPNSSMMTLAALACLPVIYLVSTNTPSFHVLWKPLNHILMLIGIGCAVWAISQVYSQTSFAVGPLKDRNALAALMNLLWFPTVYLFLQSAKTKIRIPTILFGFGIFLMSTALFATMSRGGIITWTILQPIILWVTFKNTQSKKLTAIVPVICLIAFLCSASILKSNVMDRNFKLKNNVEMALKQEKAFSSSNDNPKYMPSRVE